MTKKTYTHDEVRDLLIEAIENATQEAYVANYDCRMPMSPPKMADLVLMHPTERAIRQAYGRRKIQGGAAWHGYSITIDNPNRAVTADNPDPLRKAYISHKPQWAVWGDQRFDWVDVIAEHGEWRIRVDSTCPDERLRELAEDLERRPAPEGDEPAEGEARAVNQALLDVADLLSSARNKHEPGPIFAVLNAALGIVEDVRFRAMRHLREAPPRDRATLRKEIARGIARASYDRLRENTKGIEPFDDGWIRADDYAAADIALDQMDKRKGQAEAMKAWEGRK